MWKVYVGQYGKVCETATKSIAEAVFEKYKKLATSKDFWQPYVQILNGFDLIEEYCPPHFVSTLHHFDEVYLKIRNLK
jgi:hypothetical protein